jgi:lipid-A-disaccharide synthase
VHAALTDSRERRPLRIFLVAGELSGDQLGAHLMDALRRELGPGVQFAGVGGPAMTGRGLTSLFPFSEIALFGVLSVLRRLPNILKRIGETARAAIDWRPDALVLIDSPDFTHRVGKRVRRVLPALPILDYVSPQVWAWKSGRARTMRAYVDRILAVLPFEPEALRRLGGPTCVYVGHPLLETAAAEGLNTAAAEGLDESNGASGERRPPTALLLPGSRRSEIDFLLDDFGAAAELVESAYGEIDWVLPAVAHLEDRIRAKTAGWRKPPRIVIGDAAKRDALRAARVAIAASGTVTLELALSGTPMVVAYKVSRLEYLLRHFVEAPSMVLANLVLGARPIPELLQEACTPQALAETALTLLRDGRARDAQLEALAGIWRIMRLPDGKRPSDAAAREVIDCALSNGR